MLFRVMILTKHVKIIEDASFKIGITKFYQIYDKRDIYAWIIL